MVRSHTGVSLDSRIVRYGDLVPCYDAFIDTRTPGSDRKENFTIIGPGVSENPDQHLHISEPHGFNIGAARQPPGCTNSQHSHQTAEVFYVHTGCWRFDLGEHGDDAQVTLCPGDLISIPVDVFRGFTNIGQDDGFLWAILGGDDPGRVLWAPVVFELASRYGLILLEDGMLVDSARGQTIPPGKRPMPVTSQAQVDALCVFSQEQLEACVARKTSPGPKGEHDHLPGIAETMLIGDGRMDWPHGFVVSSIGLASGALIPRHEQSVTDVWFVHDGRVVVEMDGNTTILDPGDTMTVPKNTPRTIRNVEDRPATVIAVRGRPGEGHL